MNTEFDSEGLRKEGYTPGLYSALSWWNSYLTEIKLGCSPEYLIRQYGTAQVDGINGESEANHYYGDFGKTSAEKSTETTANNKTTATKTTTTKTVLGITYQVFTDNSGWLPVVRNLEDYE